MNPSSSLVYAISDSRYCSVAANQGKGTDSPAEKVTAQNEESPVSINYLPHRCPTCFLRSRSLWPACDLVLVSMVRGSKAEPELLHVWEITTENSDCRRQWFFPSHVGLNQPPPSEKNPNNVNPHYLMSETREPKAQLCSQLCCPSSLGHNRWESMSSLIAVSLQGHTMARREWLSCDIFQVMNPAFGNLKIVDGSCEAR